MGTLNRALETCSAWHRLTQIKSFLNKKPEDFHNIMASAAYTTCFFGFLHAGEIYIPPTVSMTQGHT